MLKLNSFGKESLMNDIIRLKLAKLDHFKFKCLQSGVVAFATNGRCYNTNYIFYKLSL